MQTALDCIIATYARVVVDREDIYRARYESHVVDLSILPVDELQVAARKYLSHLDHHYSTNKNDKDGADRRRAELECLSTFIRKGCFPTIPSALEDFLLTERNLPYRIVNLIRYTLWKDGAPPGAPRELTRSEFREMKPSEQRVLRDVLARFPEVRVNVEALDAEDGMNDAEIEAYDGPCFDGLSLTEEKLTTE